MAESGGTYEPSRAATVVAEAEPFFRDVMEVYVDLLCRGEQDASRLLFRSGVRFAAAVHGMHRATADGAATEAPGPGGVKVRTAEAARRHLERCLFALWSARQPEPQEREGQQPPVDTAALFTRGFAMLSALRAMSSHAAVEPAAEAIAAETAADAQREHSATGSHRGPSIPAPPRERPGHEEFHTWIRERTSSPPNR